MQLRPCPFCQKPIPKKMTACPYCHHDEQGQKVRMDTAAPPPDPNEKKYYENDMADLGSDDPYLREQAVVRMAQRGFGVVQALIDVLSNLNRPGLAATAKVLGRVRDRRAVPALTNALRMGDEELRSAAAWALGQIHEPQVLATFAAEADRQHPVIQAYIAYVLGSARDGNSVKPLAKLLSAPQREVAFQAACALGEIGDRDAAGPLRRALGHKEAVVRVAAAASLKRLGLSVRMLIPRKWIIAAVAIPSVASVVFYFYR